MSLQATLMKPTGSHKNKKNRCQLKREGVSGMGKGKEKRKRKGNGGEDDTNALCILCDSHNASH